MRYALNVRCFFRKCLKIRRLPGPVLRRACFNLPNKLVVSYTALSPYQVQQINALEGFRMSSFCREEDQGHLIQGYGAPWLRVW